MSEHEIWNELGNIYYNTGAYDEAIRAYLKAIEFDHACGQSYKNLALIYVHKGQYSDSISMLHKGIELSEKPPDKALLWSQLGAIFRKMDDYDNELAACRFAVELDPENAALKHDLEEIKSVLAQTNPKDTAFSPHAGTEPESGPTQETATAPEALSDPLAAAATEPDQTSGLVNVEGIGLLEAPKNRIVPSPEPDSTAASDTVSDNIGDPSQPDEAIQVYPRAISLNAYSPFPWNNLGLLYSKLGRYEDALNAFRKSIEYNPQDAAGWNGLGDVYHKLGRNEDAIAAYQLGNVFEQDRADADRGLDAYDNVISDARKTTEAGPEKAAPQTESASVGMAPAGVDPGTNTDSIKSASKPNTENPPLPESSNAGFASPETKKEDVTGTDEGGTEPAIEAETVPEMRPLPADPAGSREPDIPYWVFGNYPSNEKASQSKQRNNTSAVGTAFTRVEPSPTSAINQFANQVLIGSRLLTDGKETATVVLMEQEPEPVENDIVPIAPANMEAPKSQPNAAVDRIAHPGSTNSRSLGKEITAYRRVTEINPKNDRAWDALGNMYEAVGLHTEAIASFEKAVSLNPTKEAYHYHLGLAHAAQMHYDKAIQALQLVISLNPEYMLAHCALAGYYRRVGKEAEAQKHIAIARPSMDNENEYNRACFEAICGNVDQAIAFLKTALEKQQIPLDLVRTDPDLDLIRNDSRFESLLQRNESVDQK